MASVNYNKKFEYDPYKESELVTEAKNALDTQLAQKPGAYESKWQTQLDDTINKILNREKFTYDLNGDALYQQYKDKYIQQGKMAMGDVIGQASAMTGGFGNSYAQSVGQQAYNASLQNLNDIVPELYQMAYDKYNKEGQDLYNQYSMLGTQEEQDYVRHKDSLADWLAERDYLSGRYDSERGFDYGKYADDKNFAYTDHRNSIADEQWQKEFDEAVRQYNTTHNEQRRQHNDSYNLQYLELAQKQDQLDAAKAAEAEAASPITGIIDNVKNYTTEQGQANYLANEVNKGNITQDEAMDILNQYGVTNLTNRTWEVADDGGANLLGINRNAVVRDESGNEYNLADLRKELKKTMSNKEANAYIKDLMDELGIK